MILQQLNRGVRRSFGALVVALVAGATIAPPASAGPFDGFAGGWSGSGIVKLKSGKTERVRCKGSASGSSASLKQSLRCASTSYRFVFNSTLQSSGRSVYGTVTESRYGLFASVSGRAAGKGFNVRIRGQNVTATGSIIGRGRSQSITLRPKNRGVTLVSLSLRRS